MPQLNCIFQAISWAASSLCLPTKRRFKISLSALWKAACHSVGVPLTYPFGEKVPYIQTSSVCVQLKSRRLLVLMQSACNTSRKSWNISESLKFHMDKIPRWKKGGCIWVNPRTYLNSNIWRIYNLFLYFLFLFFRSSLHESPRFLWKVSLSQWKWCAPASCRQKRACMDAVSQRNLVGEVRQTCEERWY